MGFMQKEVCYDLWAVIDGNGTEVIPADLIGFSEPAEFDFTDLDEGAEMPDWVYEACQYLELNKPNQITTVSIRYGWGARLSAPGYMDRTEWGIYRTKKEAWQSLRE